MSAWDAMVANLGAVALWGLVATGAMTTIQEGARLAGLSRMSLPFLFGVAVTRRHDRAIALGYVLYLIGGWSFAALYALVLESAGLVNWWAGLIAGTAHGLFLSAVFLPLLPAIHPRLASDRDGPSRKERFEPPGPMGLNYGRGTPLSTILSQALYGLVFGFGYAAATGGA